MTRWNISRTGWKRTALAGLAVLLTAAMAAGRSSTSASGSQVKSVKVAPVSKIKFDDTTEQDADVIAYTQVNVIAKAGGDVAEPLKKRGDTVNQGDVLFRLDSTDAQRNRDKNRLAKENLQSQLDKTAQDITTNKGVLHNTIDKLTLQIADLEKAYNNVRNDYDSGLATKSQLDKAETQLKTAKLDLDTAQKQLANLESTDPLAPLRTQIESTDLTAQDIEKTLSDFEVKAPISGVLTDFNPEQGITIQPGYVAGVIQRLNPIKIHADVTETAAKLVRGKKDVPFVVQETGDKLTGSIVYLADVMSPGSKTYVMELSAPNAELKLKPGMRVKLQLGSGDQQEAVAVPISSIVKEGNDSFVYVLAGDQVEKRKVTLGRVNDTNREALNGVKEGEQVVVSGQQELKDKDKAAVSK
ncbi:efflux RND transporter periplasmic adaptor subunit [Paenibacillus sp. P25]|nr:efflux RND transporter periplasmic adaptor subunit [Paenibacillus sp. P25]